MTTDYVVFFHGCASDGSGDVLPDLYGTPTALSYPLSDDERYRLVEVARVVAKDVLAVSDQSRRWAGWTITVCLHDTHYPRLPGVPPDTSPPPVIELLRVPVQ